MKNGKRGAPWCKGRQWTKKYKKPKKEGEPWFLDFCVLFFYSAVFFGIGFVSFYVYCF